MVGFQLIRESETFRFVCDILEHNNERNRNEEGMLFSRVRSFLGLLTSQSFGPFRRDQKTAYPMRIYPPLQNRKPIQNGNISYFLEESGKSKKELEQRVQKTGEYGD